MFGRHRPTITQISLANQYALAREKTLEHWKPGAGPEEYAQFRALDAEANRRFNLLAQECKNDMATIRRALEAVHVYID